MKTSFCFQCIFIVGSSLIEGWIDPLKFGIIAAGTESLFETVVKTEMGMADFDGLMVDGLGVLNFFFRFDCNVCSLNTACYL